VKSRPPLGSQTQASNRDDCEVEIATTHLNLEIDDYNSNASVLSPPVSSHMEGDLAPSRSERLIISWSFRVWALAPPLFHAYDLSMIYFAFHAWLRIKFTNVLNLEAARVIRLMTTRSLSHHC
jgi:hypothetical protein